MIKIERAIISVSDKTGIVELAKFLKKFNVEILSTGGTAKILKENSIDTVEVSEFTGFPEIMEGRVKTLHPKIYGGILSIKHKSEQLKKNKKNKTWKINLFSVTPYTF